MASYQANNIVSQSKRAVGSAVFVGWGGIGGIIASLIYRQQDYPYCVSFLTPPRAIELSLIPPSADLPGIAGTMVFQVSSISLVTGLSIYFRRMNRLADEGKIVLEGQVGFRYTI